MNCLLLSGVGTLAILSPAAHAQPPVLPAPENSGIEHIIVVMMENRSFDHFLGWAPNADGQQDGLVYSDSAGTLQSTYPLAPDYQGCAHPDPDHSYAGGRVEYNGGACDGWLRAGRNDRFAIGYYTEADLPFYSKMVRDWTLCDRYFSALLGPTFPNRIYQHSAQTDRLSNTFAVCTLPTIWDRIAGKAGVSGRYYFSDLPFTALWGAKHIAISRPISQFYDNCVSGDLASVSYVDPRFFNASAGTSQDDHPHSDIRNGQVFLNRIFAAVTSGPKWNKTVLVINYDEWGGFFDHVAPGAAPIPAADAAAGATDGLRGFRVPCFVVSPWSKGGRVAHGVYDHTSILKMIEWRWSLEPLSTRDASANNLAEVLNFGAYDPSIPPAYDLPTGPFGQPCESDLTFIQSAAGRALTWTKGSILERSTDLTGSWEVVSGATSPHPVDMNVPRAFYRVVSKWQFLKNMAASFGFETY